jgi:hypothetical protein
VRVQLARARLVQALETWLAQQGKRALAQQVRDQRAVLVLARQARLVLAPGSRVRARVRVPVQEQLVLVLERWAPASLGSQEL